MKKYIKGNFKKTIFESETGYIIGLFKVLETNDEEIEIYLNKSITFTGYFPKLNDIDTYIFYGNLVVHERYGEQFNVESFEKCLPEEKDSIVTFLSSGIFKGIGEAKAKKIVKVLGKDTLHIILEHKENLLLIPTITEKNMHVLHDKLVEYSSSYQVIVDLGNLGFTTKDSIAIYNEYKDRSMDIIEDDIYQIVDQIPNIGFKKIDYIALKKEMLPNDARRIKAAIVYVIKEICNVIGHSYLTKDMIYQNLFKVIGRVSEDEFNKALEIDKEEEKIVIEEEKYYLKEMYDAEKNIAYRLTYLQKKEVKQDKKIEKYIKDIQEFYKINYNIKQIEAIKNALLKNVLVITGGPGTGKTTIINAICDIYKLKNKLSQEQFLEEVALLAPTGRASKRMALSSKCSAYTIHRFLKWNKELNKFQINENNKSRVKMVIIDEASMIDTYLFDSLLKGLFYDTKIILVGDNEQLPSVGPGQVLKDIIESEVIPTISLDILYRQKENSNIITLSDNIRNGILDTSIFNEKEDLTFIACSGDEVKPYIKEIIESYKKKDREKIQILCPMYKTKNGIDELNALLQELLNKKESSKEEINVNNHLFREKDKVMQLSNMPDENIFNGDIGIISKINKLNNKKEILVDFDGHLVKYTQANMNNLTLGYTISVHKSQGSEFDYLIIPIVKNYNRMLYRKLIYTAVTRCKKNLYLVGDIEALKMAIDNNDVAIRETTLKEKIKNKV